MAIFLGEHCEISDPKPPYTTTDETTEVEDILDPVEINASAEILQAKG
jgi:hypothetical protein